MKIGEMLRVEREKRGLSLVDVENETKIRAKYLAALETEVFGDIPGEVYILGFLRNYARFLELDPEQVVNNFKCQQNTLAPESVPLSQPDPQPETERGKSVDLSFFKNPRVIARIVGIMVIALLIVAAAGLFHGKNPPPPSTPPGHNQTSQLNPPEPIKMELELVGRERCWVLVKTDGEEKYSGFLGPGTNQKFEAKEAIYLRLGNAGGVDIIYNGKKLPSGKHGEVKDYEFFNQPKKAGTP